MASAQRQLILVALALGAAAVLVGACALPRSTDGQPFSLRLAVAVAPTPTRGPTVTGPAATQPPTPTATLAPTTAATDPPPPSPTPVPTEEPSPTPEPPTPTPVPLPTPDGVLRALRVPILMYHYVSTPPEDADAFRVDLSVPPEVFEEHLLALRGAGYETVTLRDLVLALQTGYALPERPVILTFDDGYRDHYEHAYPLLVRHGYTGTFFVVTGYVDEGRPGHLTWDQVIEMHAAGMDIQPHSYTHPCLEGQSLEYVVWQVLGSKEAIEERTGEPARFFAYPAGAYDDQVIEVLRSLDFWGGVLTAQGAEHRSDRPYELLRIRIHGGYSGQEVLAAIDQHMTAPAEP